MQERRRAVDSRDLASVRWKAAIVEVAQPQIAAVNTAYGQLLRSRAAGVSDARGAITLGFDTYRLVETHLTMASDGDRIDPARINDVAATLEQDDPLLASAVRTTGDLLVRLQGAQGTGMLRDLTSPLFLRTYPVELMQSATQSVFASYFRR